MHGGEGGATDIDDEFARGSFEGIGAWILGRNMFEPLPAETGDWAVKPSCELMRRR